MDPPANPQELIQHLRNQVIDVDKFETVFQTYVAYITTRDLLQQLVEVLVPYKVQKCRSGSHPILPTQEELEKYLETSDIKLIDSTDRAWVGRLLIIWLNSNLDTIERQDLDVLIPLIELSLDLDPANRLKLILIQYFDKRKRMRKFVKMINTPPEEEKHLLFHTIIDTYTDKEIAHNLTVIQTAHFASVRTTELFKSWNGKRKTEQAPNLTKSNTHFNIMAYWVTTKILLENDVRRRANKICKFIRILIHLLDLSNFEGAMQILAGLSLGPVQRLKKTWAKIPRFYLEEFEKAETIMSPTVGYKFYRGFIANRFSEDSNPVIPYMGVILSDITRVGEYDRLRKDGTVNWTYMNGMYLSLKNLQSYRRRLRVPKTWNPDIVHTLLNMDRLGSVQDKEVLHSMSTMLEPSNTPVTRRRGGSDVGSPRPSNNERIEESEDQRILRRTISCYPSSPGRSPRIVRFRSNSSLVTMCKSVSDGNLMFPISNEQWR